MTSISKPAIRASRYAQLNLVAPSSAAPLAPEWDRLKADVERALGAFDDLVRDDDGDRLAVAHEHTGWDGRLLALGAAAAGIARSSGLDLRAAYAAVRYGLPTDPDELAVVPPATVRDILGRATAEGVVALTAREVKAQAEVFRQFATATRRAGRPPGGVSTYGEFLTATGLDRDARDVFDALVVRHAGDPAALWQAASDARIPEDTIGRLRSQGRLAALTHQNLPLTARLMTIDGGADPGPTGLRALVRENLHTAEAWRGILDDLGEGDDEKLRAVLPPEYLVDRTPKGAAEAYARDLAERVRSSLPTAVVGQMLRTREIALADGAGEPVARLIERAEDRGFSFASVPLGPFLAEHGEELTAGLVPDVARRAVEQLQLLQRLYRATPSHGALAAVVAAGFTSAHEIARQDRKTFLQRHGGKFPSAAEAELTFRRSRRIAAITLARAGASMQLAAPPLYALSRLPTVEALLGEQDFCACEHCRSVLGPAAYLVDLLHFLDIDDASWRAMPAAVRGELTPFQVLEARRPDLMNLPLTCENTTTELPYIDIVNEIMEHRVVNETPPAALETEPAASADLIAEPPPPLGDAYEALAAAAYPLNLPFDLWLETVRAYLGRVGLRHADLLEALRPVEAAPYPPQAVSTERLGLTPGEVQVLTDPSRLEDWHRLYGYDTATDARRELRNARTLARRLGVTYQELAALVQTWFVNPALDAVGALRKIDLEPVDVMRSAGADGVAALDDDERAAFDARLAAVTRRFRQEGAVWEDFDAAAWVASAWSRMGDVLVLTDPGPGCRFDTTTVRTAGSADRSIDTELVRLNLLVRLWRRLDWTLDELDLALRALLPHGTTGLDAAGVGAALAAALTSLSHVQEVATRLGVGPRGRVDLLALWGPLPSVGSGSTYARLFLSPRPGPVFDHPEGNYLTSGQRLITHRSAVQGALGLSTDDVDAILATAGLKTATAPLTLQTVSVLFRHAHLAGALHVPVGDLITLSRLLGIDPFAATPAFLDAYDQFRTTGLTVAELDFLVAHRFDATGPLRPDPAVVLALAVEVGNGVRRLEAQHAVPSDPGLLGDDVVARELALVLPAELAGTLVALWHRQVVHRAAAPGIAEADLVPSAAVAPFPEVILEHRPDPAAPGRFVQLLSYRGVPRPARTAVIATAVPALTALLDRVLAQAAEWQAMVAWLVPDDAVEELFGWPPGDSPDAERRRRRRFATVVMPTLLTTLRRRFAVAAVGSALASAAGDPAAGLVETLVDDAGRLSVPDGGRPASDVLAGVAAAGLTVSAFDGTGAPVAGPDTVATPATPAVGSAARVLVEGHLLVPVTGTYWFGLSVTGDGDTGSLWIGEGEAPVLAKTFPAEARRVPVELRAGVAHRFVLEARREVAGAAEPLAGSVSVELGDVTVDGASIGQVADLDWRPRAAVDAFGRLHSLLGKALLMAGRLGLSARELRRFGLRALRCEPVPAPDSDAVRGLLAYVALRAEMAGGGDGLLDVLAAADSDDGVFARVAALTRREPAVVTSLARHLALTPARLTEVDGLRGLWNAMDLVARLGIDVETVVAAATPAPDRAVADGLRNAVRALHDQHTWRAVAASVNDPLRRRRRDALVTFLLHRLGLDSSRPELLYDDLLLDPGTEPVVLTSRVRLAISCVQLFVQRCLLNLEPAVHPATLDTIRWAWMKRYRVWEANRKIFLFPENWLIPELRDERTHLFTALTGTLLEGDVTDRLAEDAFVSYLRGLADIARLDVVSAWQEPDALHVIARDHNAPRTHYQRRLTDGRWTPWEAVGVQIEGDHVTAVVYRGRLHVFWVTFLATGATPDTGNKDYNEIADDSVAPPRVNVQAQLHWTELIAGQWSSRTSSELLPVVEGVTGWDPHRVVLHPTRHQDDGGADGSVTITLHGLPRPAPPRSPTKPGRPARGRREPTDRAIRFVSRHGRPSLVAVTSADLSIGIAGHQSAHPREYKWPLEALAVGDVRGGKVLRQRRPFTVVAPPRPVDARGSAVRRGTGPFFYADRPGTAEGTAFDGQSTFFVERSVHRVDWTGDVGWLPVGTDPLVDVGQVVPVVPPRVHVLATGKPVLDPVDPVDPLSVLERVQPSDWATEAGGVVVVGGRMITASGRPRPDAPGGDPLVQELES
ncbi:neuraminidase-like domain-containing protein [Geodermatophilus amargosae]|uniref:neuraminidase-like domain-containing protein n=1 Tax=Geodermatophilus amargosae TaxID=1296565 RepID=UPI001FE65C51|nr:neuraminidase-like domain-containing protein [Geodermatophilus amargosae]